MKRINLQKRIDSFYYDDIHKTYFAEYGGWHFEAKSVKALINQILKHIFKEIKLY